MAYSLKQLQALRLCYLEKLEYLPKSFTSCGAFPALIKFQINLCSLVEFPEVDEGALPNLRRVDFNMCHSLETLPLSLELLTSLRKMSLLNCREKMKDSCTINCEKSSIWRSW
jgi:hypothetical protein